MRIPAWIIVASMALANGAAIAQSSLEVVPLRYRTAEQVLPVLRPLLAPGGALTGQNNQLIIRTDPDNLAEIRRALAAIDMPLRGLVISVRFDRAGQASGSGLSARGSLRAPGMSVTSGHSRTPGRGIEVRAVDTRSHIDEHVDQRLQTIDGGRAFIATGQSRPLRERQTLRTPGGIVTTETTTMQDVTTGFEVVPRLSGKRVLLEITPQRQTPGARRGEVRGQRLSSTVSAKLGEWIEIGSGGESAARNASGILTTSRSASSERRSIWVRVDEVRP